MKKKLFVLPTAQLGGAEQVLKMIAQNTTEEVHVFFFEEKKTDTWNIKNINIHVGGQKSKLRNTLNFISFIIRQNYWDYIYTSHIYMTATVGLLIRLGILKKVFFIARESTTVFNRFSGIKLKSYRLMYKLGYPQVDLLICQTEYMRNQLIEALPWLNKKIKIRTIPNPVNLDNMIEQSKSLNPFTLKQPYIISAGRLIPEKGFDILIKAFSKISSDYPQINLVILGEGNERSVLEKLILDLELQDKIFLPGFHSNVYPIFKEAELCVVSSRIEGFPNVLLQMMSQNTKVVSTKCAGGIESINGVFTCETENIDRLADAMRECLSVSTDYFRDVFDVELKKRSISDFIYTVENILMNE